MSSMVKITVLRVHTPCQKCKKKLLVTLVGLEDKVQTNAAKGTVTITGTVDPFKVIARTRKTKKLLEIVSVGAQPLTPPPSPTPTPTATNGEKEEPAAQINIHTHVSCPDCDGHGCSIM